MLFLGWGGGEWCWHLEATPPVNLEGLKLGQQKQQARALNISAAGTLYPRGEVLSGQVVNFRQKHPSDWCCYILIQAISIGNEFISMSLSLPGAVGNGELPTETKARAAPPVSRQTVFRKLEDMETAGWLFANCGVLLGVTECSLNSNASEVMKLSGRCLLSPPWILPPSFITFNYSVEHLQ